MNENLINTESSEEIIEFNNDNESVNTSVDITSVVDELEKINKNFDYLFNIHLFECSIIFSILIFLSFQYVFRRFK